MQGEQSKIERKKRNDIRLTINGTGASRKSSIFIGRT